MSLKKLLVLFLVVISMASCDDNHQEGFTYSREGLELYKKKKAAFLESIRKDIIFSGDSLTRGVTGFPNMEMGLVDSSYPQLLIDAYGLQDIKWMNTSEPGLTTDRFVETLYKRIAVMQPKIVVVTIGGNDFLNQLNAKDVDLDSPESRQKLIDWFHNSSETLENIDNAVKTLTAQNIRVVFGLIRPGGMFTGMFEAEGYPEVSEAMHVWYGRILDTLKAIDSDRLYIVEDIMEGIWDDHISEDGIHPTQEGYHLMAKNFNLCFQKALNDL